MIGTQQGVYSAGRGRDKRDDTVNVARVFDQYTGMGNVKLCTTATRGWEACVYSPAKSHSAGTGLQCCCKRCGCHGAGLLAYRW